MNLTKRINLLTKLGEVLNDYVDEKHNDLKHNISDVFRITLNEAVKNASILNPFFTDEFINYQFKAIGQALEKEKVTKFCQKYSDKLNTNHKNNTVAVIAAGNVPLVGFFDVVYAILANYKLKLKLSSNDNVLIPSIISIMESIEPRFEEKVEFVNGKIEGFDHLIATGNNNTAKHFEFYFKDYNKIIRKNKNSVAVLSGNETNKEMYDLADDILLYFGLGCRSVSKIYIPKDYNLDLIFNSINRYGEELMQHNKYMNNYLYNRTIYLMNSEKFLDNNFFIVKNSEQISSPIGVLHFEYYSSIYELNRKLKKNKDDLQCIVSSIDQINNSIPFGTSQQPNLEDFADEIDVMKFLLD